MIFNMNLEYKKSAGNMYRMCYDGILQKDNCYYLTFCHGDNKGNLLLQINDKYIPITPYTMRSIIFEKMNFCIKADEKIFINPCFPKQVIAKFRNELQKSNICIQYTKSDKELGHLFFIGDKFFETFDKKESNTVNVAIEEFIKIKYMPKEKILECINSFSNNI